MRAMSLGLIAGSIDEVRDRTRDMIGLSPILLHFHSLSPSFPLSVFTSLSITHTHTHFQRDVQLHSHSINVQQFIQITTSTILTIITSPSTNQHDDRSHNHHISYTSQVDQIFCVTWVQPRVLDKEQLASLSYQLEGWTEK